MSMNKSDKIRLVGVYRPRDDDWCQSSRAKHSPSPISNSQDQSEAGVIILILSVRRVKFLTACPGSFGNLVLNPEQLCIQTLLHISNILTGTPRLPSSLASNSYTLRPSSLFALQSHTSIAFLFLSLSLLRSSYLF